MANNNEFYTEDRKLGERLQKCRRDANITQAEMAKATNLSKHYISAIENGVHKCNARTLIVYAKKCDVSIDYLVGLPGGTNIIIELKEKISTMDMNQQQRLLDFINSLNPSSDSQRS